ncbi:MAG: FHA domain-containing protein [Thermosynechococcaceae cyanobacterium]
MGPVHTLSSLNARVITLTLLGNVSEPPQWRFELHKTIQVGRAADNDVVLDDHQVSRHHLDLIPSNPGSAQGVWMLQSYGTNGTLLNGTLVTQGVVSHGSTIQLGLSGPMLRFEIQAPLGPATLDITVPKISEPLSTSTDLPIREVSESPPEISRPVQPSVQVLAPIQTRFCTHQYNEPGARFCSHCGELLQTLEHIRQYQVVKSLESGEGIDSFLVRPTAIKGAPLLILQRFQPEPVVFAQAQDQFIQVVERLKGVHHPSVPEVVDTFVEIPYLYVVTEQILGQTLEAWVQQVGAIETGVAIATLLSICESLTYLHALAPPLIHRNLTPKNILRCCDRQGIALLNFGDLKATNLGESLPAPFNVQLDLYRAGTALLYLLTGNDPLAYLNTRAVDHIDWSAAPQISSELRKAIAKATHPDPQRRYPTATALSEALSQISSHFSSHT